MQGCRLVFVDVDVQVDFCEPEGALYVPGSPNELYRALVRHATRHAIPIVGSVDSHAFDAWEFASSEALGPDGQKPGFPDHCVKGTTGWMKVAGTLPSRYRFVPDLAGADHLALAGELASGRAQALYFEKEVYSLFANPNAEKVLASLATQSDTPLAFVLFGVATDYCVLAATLGLRERGYDTTVLSDAIRGITDAGTNAALEQMRAAGAKLAPSAQLGIQVDREP